MLLRPLLFVLPIVMTVTPAFAQEAPVRVRGTIAKADLPLLTVTTREGATVTVKLGDNTGVSAVVPAKMSDVKANTFVGIASTPMTGGQLRAVEVLIFPEAMRGTGEGHRNWDLMPESTMTNATVSETVTRADGPVITLKYKEGEQNIFVPPDAPIVTFVPADRTELKAGAKIFIGAAQKQPDGTLTAGRIAVGRGIDPPM